MENFINVYLAKHSFRPGIDEKPDPDLDICIVIPCYNESGLIRTLQSLWDCDRPSTSTEVIVVINCPENSPTEILKQNQDTLNKAQDWAKSVSNSKLKVHFINKPDLPKKFAGVGLARKLGMDEAVYRLGLVNKLKGIIIGFDADSVCDANYLTEIENHFLKNPKSSGVSIYFEHPVSGAEFEPEVYKGVALYELHLRCLNQSLRYAGHPYAYHTVGSSFAVRMDEYVKQGGMNKRQAGEDFYFLQKIIALGTYTEINTTRVIPSPRESDRVPFGTGASMRQWMTDKSMKTYNLSAFEDIHRFIGCVKQLYEGRQDTLTFLREKLSAPLYQFLQAANVHDEIVSIRANSASFQTFQTRFFRWFNAFKVIKYLNFSHENYYRKVEVETAALNLIGKLGLAIDSSEPVKLLSFYRELDRTGFGLI
ncbi:MAG TPA: glycosyltransferase family 2 protein [Bacteroidales bacterium]